MKHLNFLSKRQSCGHSSVTLASTVGSQEEFYVSGGNSRGAFTPADVCQTSSVRLNRFTVHRWRTMLKLLSVLVLVFTFGIGQMWGEEEVYKETIFNSTNNSAQKNQYGDDWYNTTNGFRVDIENASNNNNAWEYIKIGNKNNAYTGIITTNSAINDKITKVSINIGGIQSSYVTSITLYTSPNNSTWTSRGTFTKSTGWQDVSISVGNQAANLYYKIEVVTSNSSQGSNGRLQINGIKYYHEKASGFSITYHCNGATSNCPSNASGQTKLPTTLPTPSRTGCTFAGWYTNEGLTTTATAGATLSANADLYAKWTCNVTLIRNGVADNTHTNITIGTTLASLQGEGKQGGCDAWTFLGWSKTQRAAQDNSEEMTLVTTVDGPGPYYAVYSHTESGSGTTEETASVTMSTYASDNSWGSTSSTYQKTIVINSDVTAEISSGTNSGKYYNDGVRIYQTEDATVTITTTSGELSSVKFTFTVSNTGTLEYNGSALTSGTAVDVSGTNAVFSVGNSGTATNGQVRFTAIEVKYEVSGGSTTYYSTTASCCTSLGSINGSVSLGQLDPAEEGKLKAEWTLDAVTGIGSLQMELWKKGATPEQDTKVVNAESVTISTSKQTKTYTGLDNCETYYAKLIAAKDGGTYCTDGWTETSGEATTIGYAITLPANGKVMDNQTEMGTVTASATRACAGTEITLTATPTDPYTGGTIIVKKTSDNSDVTSTYFNAGTGKLTMPAFGVTISASFTAPSQPSLSATGVALSENTLAFGNQEIDATSDAKTFTLTGLNLTTNVTWSLTGTSASMFSVSPASPILQANAEAGQTMTVTFTPTSTGDKTATLTFNSTGADPIAVELTGTGKNLYTVTFKRDGQVYDTKQAFDGETVTFPENPSKFDDNYPNFIGWAEAIDGIATSAPTLKSASDAITADVEYHAVFSSTPVATGNYAKITTLGELTDGKYVIVGEDNSTQGLAILKSEVYNQYYVVGTALTLTNDKVASPAAESVLDFEYSTEQTGWTIKYDDEEGGYLALKESNNHTNLKPNQSDAHYFTAAVNNGAWTLTSKTTDSPILYCLYTKNQTSTPEFLGEGNYTSNNIYLYKQEFAQDFVTRAIVKHTISYSSNGLSESEYEGDLPESEKVVDGDGYTISTATLSRDGYNFKGWNSSNTATTAETTLTNVTADVTLYAIWEEIPTYDIEFSVNGEKVDDLKIEDILQGTAITFPTAENIAAASAFPATDKKFMGWIEASSYASDDAPTFVISATAAADKTYYAVFADVTGDDVVDEYDNDLTFPFALWEKTNTRGQKSDGVAWQMFGFSSAQNPEGEINSANAYANLVSLGFNAKTGNNSTTLTIYHSADKETWTPLTTKEISKNQTYDDYSIDLSAIPSGAKYIKVKNSTNSFFIKSITLTQGAISDYVTNISPLSSIAITAAPTKTVYKKGELLNLENMVVTATYENERTRAVTNYTVTPNTTTALATTDVSFTVSYTEGEITKTDNQAIHVYELSGIAISAPMKTTYNAGEAFDPTGMTVTATWGGSALDKIVEENISGYTYEPTTAFTNETDGDINVDVTISYTHEGVTKTATQVVTVHPLANLTMTWNVAGETTTSKIYINNQDKYLLALPDAPEVPEAFGTGYEFIGWTSDATIARDGQGINWAAANDEMTVATEFKAVFAQVNAPFFKETFDDCEGTGGNDGSWSGTIATSTVNTDNTGWTNVSAGGARQCIKLGAGSTQGSAQTPSFSLTGSATLTFKAGAWNSSSEKTTLNISATGATLKQNDEAISSVTMTKGAWTTYTVDVTDATGTVTIKFEANSASNNRFFLDEVLVKRGDEEYKDYRFVPSSVATPVIGLTEATYYGAQNATITQAQEKQIFYSLDGNTWAEYTEPVALNQAGSVTLYAKAYDESEDDYSSVVSKSYTIVTEIADPEITPSKAFYGGSMEVEISHELSGTEGFTLQYSYDGENYVDYTTALTITEDKTVYAKATIGSLEANAHETYTKGRYITYWRVTNANQLRAGQHAIIAQHVSVGEDVKIMDAQSGNNCNAKASTATNNGAIITPAFVAYSITLEDAGDGKFAFKVPGGYLYAASSSSNHLKLQETNDANGKWKIEIGNDMSATITAQGSYTHNILKYNSSNDLFSCYASGQTAVAIYVDEICSDINVSALEDNADVTVGNGATLTIDADDKPLNDITVKDGATVIINETLQANDMTVEAGGVLDVAENKAAEVNNLYIQAEAGASGQVTGAEQVEADGLFMDVTLYTSAEGKIDPDYWYSVAVPFDVDINSGIYKLVGTTATQLHNSADFDVWYYDTEYRASSQRTGWKRLSGKMKAGKAYLIGFDDGMSNKVRFQAAEGWKTNLFNESVENPALDLVYDSGNSSEHANWNGIANPTMHYMGSNEDVQVFDNDLHTYSQFTKYNYVVGTAFFVKATSESFAIGDVDANKEFRAPKRESEKKYEFGVRIYKGDAKRFSNQMYVRASEEASAEFDANRDITTMNSATAPSALLWTENYGGKRLAIEDAPIVDNKAVYDLKLYAPANGQYRIEATDSYNNADLYLTYEGSIIWNLSMGEYTVDLKKGTTEGYGLLLQAKAPGAATGVDNIDASEAAQKVIINDHVYILRNGQMYDVNGKAVK